MRVRARQRGPPARESSALVTSGWPWPVLHLALFQASSWSAHLWFTFLLFGKDLLSSSFSQSGKTVLANFLTESSDITEYNPTQGVRILEFENPHVTSNSKGPGCEFELWDCGGDPKFESCWPALMKDSHGVVIIFNADTPSHLRELERWHSCFVQQQGLQDTQCLLIAHHKPGSGSDRGNLSLSPPLNKLKLVHSNLEDDPEEIRIEFIKYLKGIINSVSESRDREEMSIMT
ncbi:PREDICTED: intraflagellar transport protein 22 homolog [Ceratotherium simum simum]|uniref:Intraflagellar transport protein 22 homolog n=1 Tax=Ceratotherium simum simum TaxID=73337 RepID=A0ABM0I7U2_CERSS|nr:PREDICTED: intraflagellar transport protein 22 homolog [Ceratotherium simum simum]